LVFLYRAFMGSGQRKEAGLTGYEITEVGL
jgi:hypothetical protein